MPPPVLNPYGTIPQEQQPYYTVRENADTGKSEFIPTNPFYRNEEAYTLNSSFVHPQCNDKIPPSSDDFDMEELDESDETTHMEELVPSRLLNE